VENELILAELRSLRLAAQRLAPRAGRSALVDVARSVVGVQAQLTPAMMLALRARVDGLEIEDIHDAIGEMRSLVRDWSMRSTLHLVAADDLRWLIGLLGPVFAPQGKPRRLQLGLDDATVERGIRAIAEMLKPGEVVTRDIIVERLNKRGFSLDRKTQAPIHLIAQAALAGAIVLGPETDRGKSTYTLADAWLPPAEPLPREDDLARLARRYVSGYGPAGVDDFAGWSGLPMADARSGWAAAMAGGAWAEVTVGGRALAVAAANLPPRSPGETAVRLLPAFDAYVLGYKQRQDLVSPEHQPEVYHGGQTVPVVMVDGLAAGVWRYDRSAKRLAISIQPFEPLDPTVEELIRAEADDIGRFVELPVSVGVT